MHTFSFLSQQPRRSSRTRTPNRYQRDGAYASDEDHTSTSYQNETSQAHRDANAAQQTSHRAGRSYNQTTAARAADSAQHRRQRAASATIFASPDELEADRANCQIPQGLNAIDDTIRLKDQFTMSNLAEQACACCEELIARTDILLFTAFPNNTISAPVKSAITARLKPHPSLNADIINHYNLPSYINSELHRLGTELSQTNPSPPAPQQSSLSEPVPADPVADIQLPDLSTFHTAFNPILLSPLGAAIWLTQSQLSTSSSSSAQISTASSYPSSSTSESPLPADQLVVNGRSFRVQIIMRLCSTCLHSLENTKQTTPPKFSLANGLAVGPVPFDLSDAEWRMLTQCLPKLVQVSVVSNPKRKILRSHSFLNSQEPGPPVTQLPRPFNDPENSAEFQVIFAPHCTTAQKALVMKRFRVRHFELLSVLQSFHYKSNLLHLCWLVFDSNLSRLRLHHRFVRIDFTNVCGGSYFTTLPIPTSKSSTISLISIYRQPPTTRKPSPTTLPSI